jgi:hypothetical protein
MARANKKHRVDSADEVDPFAAALEEFKAAGLAFVPNAARSATFGAAALRALLAQHEEACAAGWCHESGAAVPSPRAFLALEEASVAHAGRAAPKPTARPMRGRGSAAAAAIQAGQEGRCGEPYYYASFVVNGGAVLTDLLSSLPFGGAPTALTADTTHAPRAWCFAGRNFSDSTVAGRREHTDAVPQAGTWHVQLRGTKVWKVRPCLGAAGAPWGDGSAASTDGSSARSSSGVKSCGRTSRATGAAGASGGKRGQVARGAAAAATAAVAGAKAVPMVAPLMAVPAARAIECRAGDLLLINTRTWWHCTELPPQRPASGGAVAGAARGCKKAKRGYVKEDDEDEGTLSLSVARDFDWKRSPGDADDEHPGTSTAADNSSSHVASNVDAVYATCKLARGQVALLESELPGCALPRDENPNCEVARES